MTKKKQEWGLHVRTLKDLQDLISDTMSLLGWNYKDMALEAEINPRTVSNFVNYRTKLPQCRTVFAMLTACGYKVVIRSHTKVHKRMKVIVEA